MNRLSRGATSGLSTGALFAILPERSPELLNKKILITAVVAAFCLLATALPASASTLPDPKQTGSLSIVIKYNSTPLSNINVTVHQIATLTTEHDVINYVLNEAYAAVEVDLSNISTAANNTAAAAALLPYATGNGLTGRTNSSGTASFSSLTAGLYLVVPGAASGYYAIAPYLVAIPVDDNGKWVYDNVNATPKTAIKPEPAEPKQPKDPDPDPKDPDPKDPDPKDPPPPPPPITPGGKLVPDGDGGYEEIGPDDVPLGHWTYDDEEEIWIYEEYPPLDNLPQTGLLRWPIPLMAIAGLLFFTIGWVWNRRGADKKKGQTEPEA